MCIITLLFDFKHAIGEKQPVKFIELSKYDRMEQVLAWGLQTFLCGGPVLFLCLCLIFLDISASSHSLQQTSQVNLCFWN